MLSGLRLEEWAMETRWRRAPPPGEANITDFLSRERNFFRPAGVTVAGQHTTGWPPSVRLAGHSPKGETGRREDLARLPLLFPRQNTGSLCIRNAFPSCYALAAEGAVVGSKLIRGTYICGLNHSPRRPKFYE